MNLQKLFELQKQLDEHIYEEHPVQDGEDRLAKKILALQVELGELANEWRGFKYWSKDQEPRIKDYKQTKCKWCNGSGDDGTGVCPDCRCEGDVYKEYNPLLEEYVDCLHFILSIGLEMETKKEWGHSFKIGSSIISQFHALFGELSSLFYYNQMYNYQRAFDLLIGLGEMLGFTWEQIEQSYLQKNRINHEQQNNGY
ncbi:dUTP diphosphatase [Caldifermentibacillus hisashii]|uniref:dUTP diphosphatase n=1 Tax=Caldifermentibacillus hisashii TaxID=996558 RepID=UPI0031FD052B